MCAAPPTLLQCSYEGRAWVGWHRSRRLGASSQEPGQPGERCAIRVSGMTRFEGLWSVLPTSIRSPFVPDRRVNSRSTARFPPFLDRTSAALHGSYLRQVQHEGAVQWRLQFTNISLSSVSRWRALLGPTETKLFGSPWRDPGCGWLTRWSALKWRKLWPAGHSDIDINLCSSSRTQSNVHLDNYLITSAF